MCPYILLFEDVCISFCWSYYLLLNSSYSGSTDYPVIYIIKEEGCLIYQFLLWSNIILSIAPRIMLPNSIPFSPKAVALPCLISVSFLCSLSQGLWTFCSSPSTLTTLCCIATRFFLVSCRALELGTRFHYNHHHHHSVLSRFDKAFTVKYQAYSNPVWEHPHS